MTVINIEDLFKSKTTEIVFGEEGDFIKDEVDMISITDKANGITVCVLKSDMDALIKALQKAKELWRE